ncbi:MAG TPA: alpha/beta hydrolase [Blastocatellia bacterium]|nr:alpha/beta hydrolase [Blastocatellia bacterium]
MKRNTQITRMLVIMISSIIFPSIIGSTHASRLIAKTMAVLDVDSGYVEVNDGRIFYESAGQGPTIIMIHDGLLHRETWNDQFGVFARNHRAIRWDRRGYGRSDVPKAPYSDLEDLHRLVKTLKVDRATLIGCSAGGLLTIDYALEHPEIVSGLVLVGPIVSGFEFTEHFATRGNRGMPGLDAPVQQKIEYWISKDSWIMARESVAAKKKMKELLAANPQNLTGSRQFARWPEKPALGRLSQIKVPTLIVAGESDIPDVHAHIGAIQAGISGSKRVVLTNSGHLPHIEVPEVFNRTVLAFLDTIK